MFALAIRYLTGYAVATDVSRRESAEWPPHPARVFMALAAAHFESGEDSAERDALEWLEALGPPHIQAGEPFRREVVTHYVPVNDTALPAKVKDDLKEDSVKAALGVLPHRRSPQPRAFPRVGVGDEAVRLVWPDAEAGRHRATLGELCAKVIRIGHSSSLVQMWTEDDPPAPNYAPDDFGSERLRVAGQGALGHLESRFNAEAIHAHGDLKARLDSAKGKSKTALKKEMAERFPNGEPACLRPNMSLWQTYRREAESGGGQAPASGFFDRDVLVLALQDGLPVGLETTWTLLTALRDAILSLCDPAPEWVSGHLPDGSPSQKPHLALLSLPFVSHPHADGHLLGVGLAFPKDIPPRQRGAALRNLLYDANGQPKPVKLALGALGAWRLTRETRETPPQALQGRAWTGPSRTWATATPIVLDRHPKASYSKQRTRWIAEAAESIAESCRRQGFPEPMAVDVDKTCWHLGAPRAIPGKTGFPLMPSKPGQSSRQQVHAWIRFERPVEGPLLLGAGRYRGYGVCKPWHRQQGGAK